MRTVHVVLAVQPKLLRELLIPQLKHGFELHLVEHADDELSVAAELCSLLDETDLTVDDAVVLVTSVEDEETIPAYCSRLLFEFPEISILCLHTRYNRIQSFRMRIEVSEVPTSLSELISTIRHVTDPRTANGSDEV